MALPSTERRRSLQVAEHVREAIWQMRSSQDVEGMLTAIGDSMRQLDIPFLYCGVNVIDRSEEPPRVTAHSLRRDSQWFHLEDRGAETVRHFWREQQTVYRNDLSREDPFSEYERFQRAVLSVVDVPYSHGTLAISSDRADAFTDGDIALLQTVASWLTDGFRRLDDLRALEARNVELEREVAERRRAEQDLAASLEEKVLLLREIHHRVKNNLQVVSSLLSLQSFFTSDETAKDGFRESRARIESMALIHERLYESHDMTHIDGADYLRSLTDHLFSTYGVDHEVIELHVRAEQVTMDVDTAIHSGLIVNELVSNSLKYGFPDGRTGRVDVRLTREPAGAVLEVCDDGVGLPTDDARSGSLGLQLVQDLTHQLDGSLERIDGEGARFVVRFPLPAAPTA